MLGLLPVVVFLLFATTPTILDSASASTNLNLSATVEETLSLAIQNLSSQTIDTVEAEISNGSSGITNTAKIIASTNTLYGYTLTLADSDSITDLAPYNSTTGQYDITGPKISPISETMALSSFSPNTWGYGVVYSNTNTNNPTPPSTYDPITTSPVSLSTEVEGPGTGYHYFTAAAKIGDSLAAGTYEDELVFSITASPRPDNFFDLNNAYMQDSRLATVCTKATTPSSSATNLDTDGSHIGDTSYVPSITMIDKRDNQEYTIRKLADGNCWMAENLRFGAMPDNSTTPAVAPNKRAWNPDTDPTLTDTTTKANIDLLTETYVSNADNCGPYFTSSQYAQPSICIYQANTPADYDGQTKFGALYNYCAATGGTVCYSDAMSADAPGSICPLGWKLSGMTASATGSGADISGTTKTYNNLANSYGYGNTQVGMNGMISSPLNFVRAGGAGDGYLGNRAPNGLGLYWSSTKYISATNRAYYLVLSSNSYYVSQSYYYRYFGYPLRCVLQ